MTLRRQERSNRAAGARALCALVLLVALGTVMIAASAAQAEDTFDIRNETGELFTPFNQDGTEAECWFDANGVFDKETGSAGPLSSITAEAHAFECNADWGSEIAYEEEPLYLYRENGERYVYTWEGGVGAIGFFAYDPWIGSSTLTCYALGPEWEETGYLIPIERFMTVEADGRTCTIAWLPGVQASARLDLASTSSRAYAGHVRLVDSLAPVLGQTAKLPVQVFGLGHARHRVTVTLRDRSGRRIGTGSRILPVGDRSRVVTVALSSAASRELSSRHELRVKAAVDISSHGGTGDTTTQLLLRRGLRGP